GRAFAALAAAGCLWGTGFLFGKWAFAELSVGQMVLYRFLFASVGFAPGMWRGMRNPATRIRRQDLWLILTARSSACRSSFSFNSRGWCGRQYRTRR
ncbi:MAG TPA: EamA family transporter, partial [Gemmatimonadaceae bacterium]